MRIIAPPRLLRADAPSLSILRRVMSGMVAFTAGHLANAPRGLFVGSAALLRCAECIMHRVFYGYRMKALVPPPRTVLPLLSFYIPFVASLFLMASVFAHRHEAVSNYLHRKHKWNSWFVFSFRTFCLLFALPPAMCC